jgi:hypothetical protein
MITLQALFTRASKPQLFKGYESRTDHFGVLQ